MITRKYKKKKIFILFLAFSLLLLTLTKINLDYVENTNAKFISVAPADSKSINGSIDVKVKTLDLNGNPLSKVEIDVPFIIKVTNTGTLPVNYKINTKDTENNDFSHYIVLAIDNQYTSNSSDSDFFFVSKDFLFPRHGTHEYVMGNENLKKGQTDTWQVLYSAELTRDPTFQQNVTINSRSADLKLNLILQQVTK